MGHKQESQAMWKDFYTIVIVFQKKKKKQKIDG